MTDLATTLAGSTPPTRSLSAIKESLLRKGVPWTPGALRGVMDTAARKGYEVDFDMPIRFGGGVPERISTGFEGGWKGAINSLETEGAALVNKVGLDDDHSMMNTALDRGQQIASDTFIPDRGLLEDVSSAVGSSAPMMGASLAATALSGGNPYVGLMTGVTMESMMEQGGSIQEILAATEESKRADRADGILGETADVFGKNMLINSAFAGVGGSLARAAGGKTLTSLLTGPAIKSGLGKSLVDAASESTQEFLQSLASQGRAHESLGHDISYRQAAYEGLIALPIGLAGGGVASAYERMVQAASEVAASEVRKKLKEDLTGRAQPVKDKASELKDKAQGVQNKVSDLRSKAGRTAGKVSGKAREVYESAQDQIDDFNRGAREAYAEESGLTVEQVEEQMATKAPINFFSMVDAAKTVDQVTTVISKFWGVSKVEGKAKQFAAYAAQKIQALKESAGESSESPLNTPNSGSAAGAPDAESAAAASALDNSNRHDAPAQNQKPASGVLGNSGAVQEELDFQGLAAKERETDEGNIC